MEPSRETAYLPIHREVIESFQYPLIVKIHLHPGI